MEAIDPQQEEILLDPQDTEQVLELSENDINIISMDSLCRLCANTSDRLIPIYSEEGNSNDLANKMNLYLPVKVCENDSLPLNCCWNCATTVLAWHELVVASVEADRRLKAIVTEAEAHLIQPTPDTEVKEDAEEQPSDSTAAGLSAFCPESHSVESSKKRLRNAKKKVSQQEEDAWSKDEDPLVTYMDGIRNPFISDCDLIEEEENPLSERLHDANECEEENDVDINDSSADEKDVDSFTSEFIKLKSNSSSKQKAQKNLKNNKHKLEIFEDVDENEDDKLILSEWISKSANDKTCFACERCNVVALREADLLEHMKEVHSEVVLPSKRRKKKDALSNAHSKYNKPKLEIFEEVDENEDDKSILSEWISKSTSDKASCFACECCNFLAVCEADLVEHMKETHSEVVLTIKRKKKKDTQQQQHDTEDSLEKKQRRKSTKLDQEAVNSAKITVDGRVYYHCSICGKNLHSPYTYIWHNRIHTGERPFVCDLCGKQFRVSQGLVRHLRETHQGVKNFPCDLCGRMFATRRNVEEHRRIHTNERPYICDLCGKSFKQKASLFVHNRSHNDSFPFKCLYCDQGFRTRPPLLVHETRHTGEKPYPCDVCGRCFRIKYELKRHRLIHSDEKPFSCSDCGISFRQKRYLRNHNKINHNRATD